MNPALLFVLLQKTLFVSPLPSWVPYHSKFLVLDFGYDDGTPEDFDTFEAQNKRAMEASDGYQRHTADITCGRGTRDIDNCRYGDGTTLSPAKRAELLETGFAITHEAAVATTDADAAKAAATEKDAKAEEAYWTGRLAAQKAAQQVGETEGQKYAEMTPQERMDLAAAEAETDFKKKASEANK
jgi:hypothetical protein